ncbi:Cytoplasmic GTPase/eEF2-like protein (ribosomal biogenesis) [Marasmius crinis-equi]|uniref:Cytoplasmic GTPase/eEF2-like protein (Ribosomal biogenesis) n=1 Tax=Marasmius crinis-equi TaxID=585013 RepID=A0ABR3FDZ9_9AGAR
MGDFFAAERMDDDLRWREERERRLAEKKEQHADETDASVNDGDEFQEKDDEDIYFAPEKGNVVFASAIDGWGFRVGKFAQLYAAKLGIKEGNLRRVLWGDYYLDPKTKRVISYKHLKGRALKPLFVQFVLENIWAVYDAVVMNPNSDKVTKIVGALNLKIPPRDLRSKDTRHLLSLIFSQWLSLSTGIIQAAIDIVPPPGTAQATRISKMLYPDLHEETIAAKNKAEQDLYSASSTPDALICAYVSKMFAVPQKDLPENKKKSLTAEEMRAKATEARRARELRAQEGDAGTDQTEAPSGVDYTPDTPAEEASESKEEPKEEVEVVLGFARLYSGTIRVGQKVYAVLPKYDADAGMTSPQNQDFVAEATVEGLYVMMGRELVLTEAVKAGNIFAIRGLEGKVGRSATLCAPGNDGRDIGESLINLGRVNRAVAPIVRVALEPAMPADMPKLLAGMKLLSQSDPCVETFQQQTGEHVIVTAGELHLERCLKDLRERFARIEIHVSKPIVPFRETAVKGIDMAPTKTPGAPRGTIKGSSSQAIINFTIRAAPLPESIRNFVLQNLVTLKKLQQDRKGTDARTDGDTEQEELVNESHADIAGVTEVRPDQFWPSLQQACREAGGEWEKVVDRIWAFGPQKAGGCLLIDSRKDRGGQSLKRRLERSKSNETDGDGDKGASDFDGHIETGFQLATFQGPLCAEPVEGLAYFVEGVEIDQERLNVEIADVLGKVYGVVARRRGRIVAEEMKEGTSFFTVSALLPVVESFGFADDIRKRTSGAASPQLIFNGFELLDQDPFWVPTTEEELEDLGEKADRSNIAKGYMDAVRDRKGMFVDRKIVEFAEKQRTLKR